MLFVADILSFEVDNWTYPLIQPKLLEEAKKRGYL